MKRLILLTCLILSACVTTQEPTGTPRPPVVSEYPADVQSFIDDRDGCEHFAGEEPYDDERRAFINKNIEDLCPNIDQRLADMRTKYATNKKVMLRLSAYEPLELSFSAQ